MGFKVPNSTTVLKFAGDKYDGLEVVARKGSVADAMAAERMFEEAKNASEAQGAKLIFEFLSGFIVSWNVEDDEDVSVPVTLDALIKFPAEFAWDIFAAFIEQTSGVGSELGKDSGSTKTAPAESIQMEAL